MSPRNWWNQTPCRTPRERAIYSPSVEEVATVGCFVFHEMAELPSRNTDPEKDQQSLTSCPQSESAYADSPVGSSSSPPRCSMRLRVPERYRSTRCAAYQCVWPGFALYWDRYEVTKEISGLEISEIHTSAPTSSRYGHFFISLISYSSRGPSSFDRIVEWCMGYSFGVQDDMLKQSRMVSM